ncbi:hypothetical protein A3K73_05000 [Candidatus Pacearchaeota archaeon RBG_13_36_9]|nr:MAG: hypothetical protein A3K73_05000 [Candidatus Pacearchaeota archaeon RBG_13_36_9]
MRKPTKTLAGVTPVAVIIEPRKCRHGTCLFCPTLDVPQSYTPKSPAIMRARLLDYNPYRQVEARIKAYQVMHHPTDKIELIIMGGTFLDYPIKYRYDFIKACYDALNNKISSSLEQAKTLNEKAKHRCVALCIETRPDVCGDSEIRRMLEFGCTRVELGVQMPDNGIYNICKRGHTVQDVIDSTKGLREAGFKIGYHIMPGIPGSNKKKDLHLFKLIFSNENYKPDQLKLYPCQVIKGAELESLYYKRKYLPYTEKELKELLIKLIFLTPRYCRIMRIMREIPPDYLVAGTTHIDLRKDIEQELRKNNSDIKEIRFREVGMKSRYQDIDNKNLELKITQYKASGGEEYFLETVNKEDILFALCRLHISNGKAIVRELHVYGQALNIGKREKKATQHQGLGKKLLQEAENIARKNKIKKLKIISGVGVRPYYKKLGYKLDKQKVYMEKEMR